MAPFGIWTIAKLDPSARRQAIAAQLEKANGDQHDISRARQAALAFGLWTELAAQFPQHFGERFELVAAGPVNLTAIAAKAPSSPTVSESALKDCVGHDTLIRIERHIGRTETVVGTLVEIDGRSLRFSELIPAKMKAFLQPGDQLGTAREAASGGASSIYLAENDRIVTAVPVDGPVPVIAKPHVEHRINIRDRVEAALRGEYAPRVDLNRAQEHVLRDADGKPRLSHGDHVVFEPAFVQAVKIEQNVLAAAICTELVPRLTKAVAETNLAKMSNIDMPADGTAEERLTALGYGLAKVARDTMDDFVAQLESAPDTHLALAAKNLRALLAFQKEHMAPVHFSDSNRTLETLLLGGFGTAREVISKIGLMAAKLGVSDVAGATAASSQLALQLAAMPLGPFLAMTNRADTWKPENFAIADGNRVTMRAQFLEEHARIHGFDIKTVLPGTTGCPAKVALGAGNPLTALVAAVGTRVAETLSGARGQ